MTLSEFENCYKKLIKSSNKTFFNDFIKPELNSNIPKIVWNLSSDLEHSGTFNIVGKYIRIVGYQIKIFYRISWLQMLSQFEIITDFQNLEYRSEIFNSLDDCLKFLALYLIIKS